MLDLKGNLLMVAGFLGGFSQMLAESLPAIEACFYIASIIAVLLGMYLKIYDRFKKQ